MEQVYVEAQGFRRAWRITENRIDVLVWAGTLECDRKWKEKMSELFVGRGMESLDCVLESVSSC